MKPFILDSGLSVTQALETLAQSGNKPFSASLHPGIDGVLGIRIPALRALAREIARSGRVEEYLANPGDGYMEHRTLHGLVLGQVKVTDIDRYLSDVLAFVKRINSWSVCDTFTFAGGKLFVAANRQRLFDFVTGFLDSSEEYEVRFAVVMLMSYFLDSESVPKILSLFEQVVHEGYYVRMAVAWAVSVACVRNPDYTMTWLAQNHLDSWTHNKALSKIRESFRVSESVKQTTRTLKR